jgi:hydrogenase nickel incorporation protein HypA/HybF
MDMHEMSIAVELVRQLEALADEHGVASIDAVTVAAGVFRGVVPAALDMAFEAAAEGTRAEGAELTLETVSPVALCRACGHRFEPEQNDFRCTRCRQADVELVEGNDIILASVTCSTAEETASHEAD